MQAYSDPTREGDPNALPDVEVFHSSEYVGFEGSANGSYEPGWYYWACFPGCMPDSDPIGPFATEAEALADAQDAEAE